MKPGTHAALRGAGSALLVLLLLGGCRNHGPLGWDDGSRGAGEEVSTGAPRATISALWGEFQEAKVNPAWYGALSGNFGVRVANTAGQAMEGVAVHWQITSGPGRIETFADRTFVTDSNGIGTASFRATEIGTTTITATAPGFEVAPLTFTVRTTTVVIGFQNHWPWGRDCDFADTSDILYYGFAAGPTDGPHATVAVGTPVEFEPHFACPAHIVATVVPPGGDAFDARVGHEVHNFAFRFVPTVAGTWEFVDRVSGSLGTLTAR
jgi:hypothetical protein